MNDKLINEVREYFGRRTVHGVPDELENIIDADQPGHLEIWLEKHNLAVGDFE